MQAATFICSTCLDEPHDDCTDYCAMTFVAELPILDCPLPSCPCCGRASQLVSVLVGGCPGRRGFANQS
jgi:hypothetical protein